MNKLTVPQNFIFATDKEEFNKDNSKMEDFLPYKHKRASSEFQNKKIKPECFNVEVNILSSLF